MRENRTYGSEGGGTGNSTGSPYPYRGYVATSLCFYRKNVTQPSCRG